MIRGLGIDITELDRIKASWDRYGEKFARRILTENEVDQLPEIDPIPRLAALFAAKEAAVKALGTGFADGVGFQSIEILHAPSGKPEIAFHGRGLEVFQALGAHSAFVSLTHGRDTAAATVILEG